MNKAFSEEFKDSLIQSREGLARLANATATQQLVETIF